MKYSEHDDTVTLEMSRAEHDQLLIMLGMAAGTAANLGHDMGPFLKFVNDLEEGNPRYTPYKIPEGS